MKHQEQTERKHKRLKVCHLTANSRRGGTDVCKNLLQQSVGSALFSMTF